MLLCAHGFLFMLHEAKHNNISILVLLIATSFILGFQARNMIKPDIHIMQTCICISFIMIPWKFKNTEEYLHTTTDLSVSITFGYEFLEIF
jgi:hypothetical protein